MAALFDSAPARLDVCDTLDNLVAQRPHDLWRGDRMASCRKSVLSSGYPTLDAELPDRGWPRSVLIELLLPHAGMGEMHLLRPALSNIARSRRVALIQPPHAPQVAAWQAWGFPCERLLWLNVARTVDVLWSAEQLLRSGCCGALLLWQTTIRPEALRRLHLAAHAADTLFWILRPEAAGQETSPAPLRLGLQPAHGGIHVGIVKRRGPPSLRPFFLPLAGFPGSAPASPAPDHGLLDRRTPAAAVARDISPALV